MIPDNIRKIIDELLDEVLSEDGGGSVSTTASAGGEYTGKYFLKKLNEKTPTLAAGTANISSYTKDGFKRVPEGMPSDSKVFDYKQFPSTPKPKSIKLYKEEQLNEISYRRFNENVSKITPERKITRALSEVKKRVKEIEQVIEYFARLKDENTVKKDTFWASKIDQLEDLSERLHELSQNVKKLSK
jgi:hypothetical protein